AEGMPCRGFGPWESHLRRHCFPGNQQGAGIGQTRICSRVIAVEVDGPLKMFNAFLEPSGRSPAEVEASFEILLVGSRICCMPLCEPPSFVSAQLKSKRPYDLF